MESVDPVLASYDAVAERYAAEVGDELAGKPLDRALYACFAELVGPGARVGDIGCGPGHVTDHLAGLGLNPVGVDPAPAMLDVARRRYPRLDFHLGGFTDLAEPDAAWAGAVAPYSLIHVEAADRPAAYAELARVIAPGGWLLIAFHLSMAGQPAGSVKHLTEWWGHPVDLNFHFLDPDQVTAALSQAGFTLTARTDREPTPAAEAPSRRCFLLLSRNPAPAG